MTDEADETDIVILKAVEEVEERIAARENRRFRTFYVLAAVISFVGIGVVTQLVDFYASKAVEQRLDKAKQEYQSAKAFAQLLAFATKLDVSDSFSHTERDQIMRLLEEAHENKQLRSEPVFGLLLEKIVSGFSKSGNNAFVNQIYDSFETECLRVPGIVETLLQHYARYVVGHDDPASEDVKKSIHRFENVAVVAPSVGLEGATAVLSLLVKFRVGGLKPNDNMRSVIESYAALDGDGAEQFMRFVVQFSDEKRLGIKRTPEHARIVAVGRAFQEAYSKEINQIFKRMTVASED